MILFNEYIRFLDHQSHSGDLLLWVGVRRRASSVVRRASCVERPGQSYSNLVCSICRVRRQEIVKFMTPNQRAGNFGVKRVKLRYFFKNLFSLLPGIDQINQVCSNDDKGRVYQNCKFHDPRDWFLCVVIY